MDLDPVTASDILPQLAVAVLSCVPGIGALTSGFGAAWLGFGALFGLALL